MAIPIPEKSMLDAKQQFLEASGGPRLLNIYLSVAVVCLSIATLSGWGIAVGIYGWAREQGRIVVRVNDVGRADAVMYKTSTYTPQEGEFRYFLTHFVHDLYSRNRATVKEDISRALYFLDRPLGDATLEHLKKTKEIETLLSGGADEVEVHVRNIALRDIRQAPYSATVDYEKVYSQAGSPVPVRREQFVANVIFDLREDVPNNLIPINPLGIRVTYIRSDQAFAAETN